MTLAETLAAQHGASFARGWSAQEFEALLANPTTQAVPSPYGFALLQIIPPEAELITISILPTSRRQGHGGTLLRQAVLAAQTRGATTMHLEVEADNTAALVLYGRAGFQPTGRRAGYYARPGQPAVDAITMTCALQSGT